jgi:hypothetical protein
MEDEEMKFAFPTINDGCLTYYDLTGYTFGYLTVLTRAVKKRSKDGKRDAHWWKCRCVCGKIRFASRDYLLKDTIRSCGCQIKIPFRFNARCPAFRAIIIDHRINTTKSCSQIGDYFGVTKNAVVGILDRAGMIGIKQPEPEPTTMIGRINQFTFPERLECAYPNGEPWEPGFSWCSAPVKLDAKNVPVSSFCPEHHGKCYIDETKAPKGTASIETMDLTQQRPNPAGEASRISGSAADEAA